MVFVAVPYLPSCVQHQSPTKLGEHVASTHMGEDHAVHTVCLAEPGFTETGWLADWLGPPEGSRGPEPLAQTLGDGTAAQVFGSSELPGDRAQPQCWVS